MTNLAPSVQLYTIRDAISENLAGAISRVASLGFTKVEPYGFVERVKEYARALGENGLVAPTAHAMMLDQDFVPMLKAASELGIQSIIDPYTIPERWKTKEDILKIASGLNSINAAAKDFGIQVGYHNHNWEFVNQIDGKPAIFTLVDALQDDVVLEIDTYWAEVGNYSAVQALSEFGDRVVAIHIKDGTRDGDLDKQCPAGQGEIPVAEILKAVGNALPVIEFDFFKAGDVFEGIAQSLAFVTKVRA